jgi:hypothetical protein
MDRSRAWNAVPGGGAVAGGGMTALSLACLRCRGRHRTRRASSAEARLSGAGVLAPRRSSAGSGLGRTANETVPIVPRRVGPAIFMAGREEPRSASEPCPYVTTTSRPSSCSGVGCLPVIPAKAGTYAAWVPAFEAVIQFPPTNLRLRNGHVRIASAESRIANSTTGLEKRPSSPLDFGSIGAKPRSLNWITASYAGTTVLGGVCSTPTEAAQGLRGPPVALVLSPC